MPLEAIARTHADYGYRRTTTELRETHGHHVNRKVVRRLHQQWDLSLMRGAHPPKPSGVRRAIEAAGKRVNLLLDLEDVEIGPFGVLYEVRPRREGRHSSLGYQAPEAFIRSLSPEG